MWNGLQMNTAMSRTYFRITLELERELKGLSLK